MLPSSGRSIGEQSTTTLPANRSIIVADSRYRKDNVLDTPYNFNCDLGGTGIYAKEIYYQKLFWNQPIFSHNNENCELLFQMNGDTSVTYVVYATPYMMFHKYDGNEAGQSLLTPTAWSYAAMMEIGLNRDVRIMPLNTTLANGDGSIRDPTDPLHSIILRFRYSPTKGFCVYPLQDSPTDGYYYSIRFLSCSYINKAHYVHGFGFYDTNNPNPFEYTPHEFFSTAIWSDCSPNLLPFRYIVVQSQELNKDRRLISFHNGNSANFVNELGIFSINPVRTGVFHEVGVGDDATVISLRDDYTPQTFRIQILDENGGYIYASDCISALMQSPGVDPSFTYPYISSGDAFYGRGSPMFINYLVFGYQRFYESSLLQATASLAFSSPTPLGMQGATLPYQYVDYHSVNVAQNLSLSFCVPLILQGPTLSASPQGLGFNQNVSITSSFLPALPTNYSFTVFTYYPGLNPFPEIRWDIEFETRTYTVPGVGSSYFYYVMFDAISFQTIATVPIVRMSLPAGFPVPFTLTNWPKSAWVFNPDYVFPTLPSTLQIGFAFAWAGDNPAIVGSFNDMYGPSSPVPPWPEFSLANSNDRVNIQSEYLPVNTSNSYEFGDPQALALPEEVIHEIAAILEYN